MENFIVVKCDHLLTSNFKYKTIKVGIPVWIIYDQTLWKYRNFT